MNENGNSASAGDRGMGVALRTLNKLAGSSLLDRIGIRKQFERMVFTSTKGGFRSATAAARTFKAAQKLGKPARQRSGKARDLFDLTPDDEQQMFEEAVRDFAAERVRPAAQEADADRATPPELLAQANELGINMLGVPSELEGVMEEQSAVAGVLIGEALAHGDMGVAYAALAPGAVATAIGRWGTADQESAYLPAFTGEDTPAAALAILEPRPLFNPLELETKARRDGGDWVIDGTKSLLARARECELFVVAADAEGIGPALFVVESGGDGLAIEDEPAMGLRPAATGRLLLDGARVPAGALMAEGEAGAYAECVQRARIAWCALAVGDLAGRPRLRDPLRQRAHGLRRTDLQPPGGRLRGVQHRDRVRRDAAGDLPGREPRRPGQGVRPRGRPGAAAERRQGNADRVRRGPAPRRPRLRQGAPGGALVPRPPRSGRDGGRPARLGSARSISSRAKGRR